MKKSLLIFFIFILSTNIALSETKIFGVNIVQTSKPCSLKFKNDIWSCKKSVPSPISNGKFGSNYYINGVQEGNNFRITRLYFASKSYLTRNKFSSVTNELSNLFNISNFKCSYNKIEGYSGYEQFNCRGDANGIDIHQFGVSPPGAADNSRHSVEVKISKSFLTNSKPVNKIIKNVNNKNNVSIALPLEKAKKQCIEIGFKEKTEKFGECVLKLIEK